MSSSRILVVDNYDSFTYNLVQFFGRNGADMKIVRNDEMEPAEMLEGGWRGIVLSPGPCTPHESRSTLAMLELIRDSGTAPCPVLGVCLGHQAIGVAFGGQIKRSQAIRHGKLATVSHHGQGLFERCPTPTELVCYHSLVIDEIPADSPLKVVAKDELGETMGLEHDKLPLFGIQFHPESMLSEDGEILLDNFLNRCLSD